MKKQKNTKRFCTVLLVLCVLLSMTTVISARYTAIKVINSGLDNQQRRLRFLPRGLYGAVRI